jgi:hypothetical protein
MDALCQVIETIGQFTSSGTLQAPLLDEERKLQEEVSHLNIHSFTFFS